MRSSLSAGEKSFVYYDATHDADEVDRYSDPSAVLFADVLARTILHLLSTNDNLQYATTLERSRSRGSNQQPSSTRTQPQSFASTNQSRKRGRANLQLSQDRGPSGEDDEGEEEDESGPGRPYNKKAKTGDRETLFACPFYKHDPLSHRKCDKLILRTISALKQHLYRNHKRPEHYCERCFAEFPQARELALHYRNTIIQCIVVSDKYGDKMTADAFRNIKNRSSGDYKEVWYDIYGTLFPDDGKPMSPFVDEQESVTHVYNIFVLLAPQVIQQLAQRQLLLPEPTQAVFNLAAERWSEAFQLARQEATQGTQNSTQRYGLLTPHTSSRTDPTYSTQDQFVNHGADSEQGFSQPLYNAPVPIMEPRMSNSWAGSDVTARSYTNQTALHGSQQLQPDYQATANSWEQLIANNGPLDCESDEDLYPPS